mgnify:CR=1 FL=1
MAILAIPIPWSTAHPEDYGNLRRAGVLLGIVLALVKISKYKPLIWFGRFYTSIFRGTPLLVQLCIVHFGLPQLLGFTLTTTQSGILTFTLNSAAYVSEIFRGGIMGVDKGQYEASMSLGIGYGDMMKDIIIPQAVKHILPSLVNEAIALLKGVFHPVLHWCRWSF